MPGITTHRADVSTALGRQPFANALRRVARSEMFAVTLQYAALVALATYPAIFEMGTHVIGDPYSDVWKHMWGLWWYHDALINRHDLPLFSAMINYPQGGYLYFADPMTATLSIPLQPLLGLTRTYNVMILLQLLGGCVGGYLLARELDISPSGAFLSGTIYALSPYVLSYSVGSGVTETINLAWPPLFVAYLLRSLRGEGLRAQVLAGVFLFLTAFSCWYYSEFMLLMTALTCVFAPAAANLRRGAAVPRFSERLKAVLPILAVGLGLVMPFAAAFAETIHNPYNVVMPEEVQERTQDTVTKYMGENQLNYTGILDFWRPGKEHATTTESMDRLTRVYYVSWVVTALVIAGLAFAPRPWSPATVFWLCLTLGFMFLTLGRDIHLYSASPEDTKICASWPYLFVYHTFPLFKQIAQPFRMMLLVYMGLGILSGMAVDQLTRRFPSITRWAWLLAVSVLAETIYISPTPYPIPMAAKTPPAIYLLLAQTKGTGTVYDVPGQYPGAMIQPGIFFYYQTFHNRAIPYRTSGETSPQVKSNEVHKVLDDLIHLRYDDATAQAILGRGIDDLRRMKVQYIVVHRRILGVQETDAFVKAMEATIAPPGYQDDEVVAWRLYTDKAETSR